MLKLTAVFLLAWALVAAGCVAFTSLSGKQKLSFLATVIKSGIAALVAVILLSLIVFLF